MDERGICRSLTNRKKRIIIFFCSDLRDATSILYIGTGDHVVIEHHDCLTSSSTTRLKQEFVTALV